MASVESPVLGESVSMYQVTIMMMIMIVIMIIQQRDDEASRGQTEDILDRVKRLLCRDPEAEASKDDLTTAASPGKDDLNLSDDVKDEQKIVTTNTAEDRMEDTQPPPPPVDQAQVTCQNSNYDILLLNKCLLR